MEFSIERRTNQKDRASSDGSAVFLVLGTFPILVGFLIKPNGIPHQASPNGRMFDYLRIGKDKRLWN